MTQAVTGYHKFVIVDKATNSHGATAVPIQTQCKCELHEGDQDSLHCRCIDIPGSRLVPKKTKPYPQHSGFWATKFRSSVTASWYILDSTYIIWFQVDIGSSMSDFTQAIEIVSRISAETKGLGNFVLTE